MRTLRERQLADTEDKFAIWPKDVGFLEDILEFLVDAFKVKYKLDTNKAIFQRKIKDSEYSVYGEVSVNPTGEYYNFELCFKQHGSYCYLSRYAGKGIEEFAEDFSDAFAFYSNPENFKKIYSEYESWYSTFPPKNTKRSSKRTISERKLNPGEKAEDLWPKEDSLRQQILDVLKGAYKFSCSTKQNIDSFWKKVKGSQTWPIYMYGKIYFNENATHYHFQISFKHPIYSWDARYWYTTDYVGKGIEEFLDDIEDAFTFYSEIENAKQTNEQYNLYCSFPPKNEKKSSKELED